MPNKQELVCHPPQSVDGLARYAATMSAADGQSHTFCLDIPPEWTSAVTPNADPFVLGFLFHMLYQGQPVHVRGTVSPSLLANLERLMQYWQTWRPRDCRAVPITADEERELDRRKTDSEAVMCFSGGIDACYTAWRHHRGDMGHRQQNLKAGIFCQGFLDTPLEDELLFKTSVESNRCILESIGMELIPLRTNAREMPWMSNLAHGPTIGACLQLFAGRFNIGLVANSVTYNELDFIHGTTPACDPLMSSRGMKILDDGGEAERYDKIAALAAWPEALDNLRICNRPHGQIKNCGTCEKCIRTILSFRLATGLLPACFDRDPSDRQIRKTRIHHPIQLRILQDIVDEARRRGQQDESWVKAVHQAARRGRWRLLKRRFRESLPWNRKGQEANGGGK
jgi:hypothetical protein